MNYYYCAKCMIYRTLKNFSKNLKFFVYFMLIMVKRRCYSFFADVLWNKILWRSLTHFTFNLGQPMKFETLEVPMKDIEIVGYLLPCVYLKFVISGISVQFSSVQSLSRVRLFSTPWIATCQASLSITNSQRVHPDPDSICFLCPELHSQVLETQTRFACTGRCFQGYCSLETSGCFHRSLCVSCLVLSDSLWPHGL